MKIRKSQIIFYVCLSFIIGAAIASFFALPYLFLYLGIISGVAITIITKKRTLIRAIGWCLVFLCLGIIRYQLSTPIISENHIAYYNNPAEAEFSERQSITFQGIIVDEPDVRKDHVKYKVVSRQTQGLSESQWKKIHGNVLVRAGLFPQYQYGDVLEITCALTEPEPIEDFRYDKYLANSSIYSICYHGQIELIDSGQGNFFKAAVFKIKAKVVAAVSQILPEPQASFLGGLLWGAKKGMPQNILENFNRTGVTHIIAVSGYNITIIAVMLSNLFISFGLSRKKAFFLIVLGIVFFVIITGSPASIIRAGVMGVVALVATTVGRAAKMHNTLAIVCLLMLLFNPKVLIWDAGFQLSFLATIGLIYFVPVLKEYTKWLPAFFEIRESMTTTLSAIVLTTPLILFQFGRFSFLAPFANLLILPLIPINMAVGFLAVVFGLIWVPLGQAIGYVSWVILTYVLKLAEILGNLSWASVPVPNFHWVFMVGGYIIIGFLVFKNQQINKVNQKNYARK
ncbi:ComEC family competence protein [Patescibacteria group bacterium]|nr:ComEC family competence protein [Patescibacteria group bacterium]